jgi:hypothetical protein
VISATAFSLNGYGIGHEAWLRQLLTYSEMRCQAQAEWVLQQKAASKFFSRKRVRA